MANRYFNQFQFSLEKMVVSLYAQIAIGATGAPTLTAAKSKGIKSVVRNSAGNYTVNLGTPAPNAANDVYFDLLMVSAVILNATASTGPGWQLISQQVNSATTPSFVIQFYAADGTTAADPSNGAVLRLKIELKNSNAP